MKIFWHIYDVFVKLDRFSNEIVVCFGAVKGN